MDEVTRYHGFSLAWEDKVAVLTLESPGKPNPLDLQTKRDLAEAVFRLNIDGRTRAILLTGAGGSFCAGDGATGIAEDGGHVHLAADMPEYGRQPAHTYRVVRSVTHALIRAFTESDLPAVAALDGFAIQSGLSLALACDIRVASPGARLSSGTLRFAMLPDEGGSHLLVQTIGLPAATKFVLLSEFARAEEALALGLVHEVTAAESAYTRGLQLAAQLASGPATALRLAKRSLRRAADSTLEQSMDAIALSAAISDYDPDFDAGRKRLRDKTPPAWRQFTETSEGNNE